MTWGLSTRLNAGVVQVVDIGQVVLSCWVISVTWS
jgi:hypothetical protein